MLNTKKIVYSCVLLFLFVGCGGSSSDGNTNTSETDKNSDKKQSGEQQSSEKRISYLLKTGQIKSYIDGDDGYYQKGLDRIYIRNEEKSTLIDKATQLEWQDNEDVLNNTQTWEDAISYCRTLAKGENWRLPTAFELRTTIDYSKTNPAIDSSFKNIGKTSKYWSSGLHNHLKWFGSFDTGRFMPDSIGYYSGNKILARCVKGNFYIPLKPLTRNQNTQIVYDSNTNLFWQDDFDAATVKLSWENAIRYCEDLKLAGFDDWRLPNITELHSIRDYNIAYAKIKNGFLNENRGSYWSSTTRAYNEKDAWTENYTRGIITGYNSGKNLARNVRCVR